MSLTSVIAKYSLAEHATVLSGFNQGLVHLWVRSVTLQP